MSLYVLQLADASRSPASAWPGWPALHLLIGRILADERKAAIHLSQILGAEDKHQLILYRDDACSYSASSGYTCSFGPATAAEGLQLRLQNTDIAVDMVDIFLDTINLLLALVYLTIQSHQVFQAFLHIGLVSLQGLFLLPDFLLDSGTLSLQSSDGGIAIGGSSSFLPSLEPW